MPSPTLPASTSAGLRLPVAATAGLAFGANSSSPWCRPSSSCFPLRSPSRLHITTIAHYCIMIKPPKHSFPTFHTLVACCAPPHTPPPPERPSRLCLPHILWRGAGLSVNLLVVVLHPPVTAALLLPLLTRPRRHEAGALWRCTYGTTHRLCTNIIHNIKKLWRTIHGHAMCHTTHQTHTQYRSSAAR